MKIIAHRGLWLTENEKNSLLAVQRAVDEGFGVEIDVRDRLGEIVVSHDKANESSILFSKYLEISKDNTLWAINIKADGLAHDVKRLLTGMGVKNYFAFDMSVPEMYVYQKLSLVTYISVSDICTSYSGQKNYSGLWLDSFESLWYDKNFLLSLPKQLPIVFVSEELHRRRYLEQWKLIKDVLKGTDTANIGLCTDYPLEAREFFK